MSTSQTTAEYILDQAKAAGTVSIRKMFGEYAIYCDGQVVGLICDDQLFIKYTEPGKKFAAGRYEEGRAYPGAKPSMNVTDALDNADFIAGLIKITATNLPVNKKKKSSKQASA